MLCEVAVSEFQVYILVSDISCQILNNTTLTCLEIEWWNTLKLCNVD